MDRELTPDQLVARAAHADTGRLAGQAGANRAIEIADFKFPLRTFLVIKCFGNTVNNPGIEFTLVMRGVANSAITSALQTSNPGTGKDRVKVNATLLIG